MNDYIIQVDENGQPYIAHAFWNRKGATKKNHKYIMKIGEGAKARYFYTQEEIRAYQQEMANKAKGGIKKAKDKAAEITEKTKDAAKKAATIVPGVQERRVAKSAEERAKKEHDEWWSSLAPNSDKDPMKEMREAERAANEAYDAKKAYNKTALSKVEKFVKDPIGTTGDAIDDAVWTVEDKVRDVKDKITDKRQQKALSKDPKVVKAQKAKEEATAAYDNARANIEDYCESKGVRMADLLNGKVDDPYAKKLADKYWDANDDLRFAYLDYNTATKKYGVSPTFSDEHTRHW